MSDRDANPLDQIRPEPAAYVVSPRDGGYLYKGSARNLRERLEDHRAGRVSRTKNRRPLMLVYAKYFPDYDSARRHEMFLKSGIGRRKLKDWLGRKHTDDNTSPT